MQSLLRGPDSLDAHTARNAVLLHSVPHHSKLLLLWGHPWSPKNWLKPVGGCFSMKDGVFRSSHAFSTTIPGTEPVVNSGETS